MKNGEFLSAMKQVEAFSTGLHSISWVWGGLTVDIHQGRFLREHHDLDYLTLHLHELVEPLAELFYNTGWQSRRLENADLQIENADLQIHLGHVEFSGEVRWTHNGESGSLFFPAEWFDQRSKRFYDIDVHVVAPEFQYALLDHPELLNPDLISRDKDLVPKTQFKTMLEARGIATDVLHTRIHE
jgi:hypothetical protein